MSDTELTIESAVNRRFELDAAIEDISRRHTAELAPLVEEMKLCEAFVKQEMLTRQTRQIKTLVGHETHFTTKTRASVSNAEEFMGYVISSESWNLLTNAANKTAVQEYMETHPAPPPGVKFDSFQDLAWRRGKGA